MYDLVRSLIDDFVMSSSLAPVVNAGLAILIAITAAATLTGGGSDVDDEE
jgi:hypothetical protein